ncbi:MAG: hypothetical protein LBD06_00065 [Candidatus Accumulibacter sp.]|jgi:hypothetical protein|nr:hypothetical protein [Accumulibacter sp.]
MIPEGETEDRGQRFERTEDRETQRSVFCPLNDAPRRKFICLLSSQITVLCIITGSVRAFPVDFPKKGAEHAGIEQ